MIWNPFKKKEDAQKQNTSSADQAKTQPGKKESIEEKIEREFATLPGPVKKQMSDPAVKARFIEIAKRMEKDGVDFKNIKQMKKWIKAHESELKEEHQNGHKIQTVVKSDDEKIGRNDPCPCGSGKKYKKCCGSAS
ncbi:C-terminal domain of SecA-like putative metal-binding protein [Elusimicrobium minutum Pei191]|uniref:C-terminal domain of SecA-like putative metal-binding protein n=1 Tax=Elusimicrobium minutum (strain Pei191) TaxID=445932 RepID=B2KEH4_ELUMP|nr:SEC-C metal-binding domain-containing protein [Elusimicrobium minutum]ACC98920.1 C-terminal domain of SecA-like putative metal-binding protein [Elusimicrobium minutum Pei191]